MWKPWWHPWSRDRCPGTGDEKGMDTLGCSKAVLDPQKLMNPSKVL